MKRIRQACRILTKESRSDKEAAVSQEVQVGGSMYDEWGIARHHFPALTDETTTRSGVLKHAQSMPFFSREPRISGDVPAATNSSRPPPTSRHLRKNSKAARLLGIASTPENNSTNDVTLPNYAGVMSPPLLPMDDDPFASRPLGALVLGSGNPASQMHTITQLTSQHVAPPASLPPSAPVPTEHPITHTSTQHVRTSQHAHRPPAGSDAQRIPRSQARTGSTAVGVISARSHSHPPPISSVPDPVGALSQAPSYAPNSTNNREHWSTSTQTTHQADSDTLGPRVRDTTVTHRNRYQNKFDPAPTPAPRLRKAHSSFVLTNGPMPPLHAPKPLKLTGQPSVEILHVLAESMGVERSYPNNPKAPTAAAAAAAAAIWPPAPVIRPLPLRTAKPPRAEQEAFRAAAIEADKAYRKVCYERGLAERVRSDRGREARREERDYRHRRAATENSRRYGGRREVEYRTMADYGYYPADQLLAGRAW